MKNPKTSTLPGPAAGELRAALGSTQPLWEGLLAHLEAAFPPVTREWQRSGKTGGWYLRLRRKDRTLLYLLLRDGYFLTAFVLGEKATAAVRASGLPAAVITALNEARPYAEGRGIRLETRTAADLATMKALAAIKMSH
jgi:hypothetical protein